MILDRISYRNRNCEERSDVAISYSASSYTIEIATLPSVARDDAGLMAQPLLRPVNPPKADYDPLYHNQKLA